VGCWIQYSSLLLCIAYCVACQGFARFKICRMLYSLCWGTNYIHGVQVIIMCYILVIAGIHTCYCKGSPVVIFQLLPLQVLGYCIILLLISLNSVFSSAILLFLLFLLLLLLLLLFWLYFMCCSVLSIKEFPLLLMNTSKGFCCCFILCVVSAWCE